jgi:hypothetical protein
LLLLIDIQLELQVNELTSHRAQLLLNVIFFSLLPSLQFTI